MQLRTASVYFYILFFLSQLLSQAASAQSEVDLISKCNIIESEQRVSCDVRLNTKVPDDLLRFEEEKFSKVSLKWPDQPARTLPLQLFSGSDGTAAWLILIDQSKSLQQSTINAIKNDFSRVIQQSEQTEDNELIGIGTFAEDFSLSAPIGSSFSVLEQTLDKLAPVGNQTLLYASAEKAIYELAKFEADRKALVIVSDGEAEDADPDAARFATIRAAREANIVIYSVAYAQKAGASVNFEGMRELAEKTGGPFRQADLSRISSDGADGIGGYSVLSDTYAERFYEFLKNGGSVAFPLRNLEDDGTVKFTLSSRLENVDWLPDLQQAVRLEYNGPITTKTFLERVIASFEQIFGAGLGLFVLIVLVILILTLIALGIYVLFFRQRDFLDEPFAYEVEAEQTGPELSEAPPAAGNGTVDSGSHANDAPTNIIANGAGERGEIYGWLEVLDSGERIPLKQTGLRIGRHKDNDIRFTASTVHRRHAVVHMTPQRDFMITDLSGNLGNGVQVNSERVAKAMLRNGDVIQFGDVQVKFHAATI